jgi:hypothetical protein
MNCPFCHVNMLAESVVQRWMGVDYETIIYYYCTRCELNFEKINQKLLTKKNAALASIE